MRNKLLTATNLSLLFALILVATSYFFTQNTLVNAGEVYFRSAQVISPKPPIVTTYEAGSREEFRIQYSFHYCANTLPTALGAITRPVPYGQAHTAFGPERVSALTTGVATGNANAQYRYYFNSTYNQFFNVPNTPGTYWFKYIVGTRNGQNTDQFYTGTVIFKVDPVDACTNIDDTQITTPSGYYETVNQYQERVCYEEGEQDLRCTVSRPSVFVGENVIFESSTTNNSSVNFAWFKGNASENNKIKEENNRTNSSYVTSYETPGNYYVTSQATASNGAINVCRIGVTVYPDPASDLADSDGDLYFTDPNAPAGVIDFTSGPTITNGACKLSWEVSNMLGCELYKNGEVFQTIEFSGDIEVNAGIYQIKCLQLRDATEVVSDPLTCRKNPDIREI